MSEPHLSGSEGRGASQIRRLTWLLLLNVALVVGLVVVGWLAHSIGVLATGVDCLADAGAIVLGLVAVHLRDRRGQAKAPTYVALANAVWLLVLTVGVIVESAHRLLVGGLEVAGLPVLVAAGVSTVAMVLGALILGSGAHDEDLHMRSVLLDTLADAASACAVAIVGAVVLVWPDLAWLDPAVGIVLGSVIGYGALRLLRDVARAFRAGETLDLDDD